MEAPLLCVPSMRRTLPALRWWREDMRQQLLGKANGQQQDGVGCSQDTHYSKTAWKLNLWVPVLCSHSSASPGIPLRGAELPGQAPRFAINPSCVRGDADCPAVPAPRCNCRCQLLSRSLWMGSWFEERNTTVPDLQQVHVDVYQRKFCFFSFRPQPS